MKELQGWRANVVTNPWANAKKVEHEYGIRRVTIDESSRVDALLVAVGYTDSYHVTWQLKNLCASENPVLADVRALFNRHDALKTGFTVFCC